jgi:hypothetical protein
MRKTLALALMATAFWQCQNSTNTPAPNKETLTAEVGKPVQLQTHAEASDTLLADTTAALKPLKFTMLSKADGGAVLSKTNFEELLVSTYPDNGFYGDNRYRIEFIFTSAEKDPNDPYLIRIKGKNRYKKTISTFEGLMQITSVRLMTDPNMDTEELNETFGSTKIYAVSGLYAFNEDTTLNTSGQFAGKFQMEFTLPQSEEESGGLWYFSDKSPAEGSGYRFDGFWTSFNKPDMKKPVLWSRDLFRFANNILKDFAYGERDIEINPKYRALGWDNFWDGEEWWTDAPKDGGPAAK